MTNLFNNTKAWPFAEARRLLKRPRTSSPILFETGFGPSGYPHIGTLSEVLRTSWVRRALTCISGETSRLVVFSDDMDGLRRSPSNLAQEGMLDGYINHPLCRVPDPDGVYESFSDANNARLLKMLVPFEIDFEFVRSSDMYMNGRFDQMMHEVLVHHDEIVNIVRPTLGEARAKTWSPIMPIHPHTGQVMTVAITPIVDSNTVEWTDPVSGEIFHTSVLGGSAKLGWKADWGMRWTALGVDYEMNGKDLIESVKLSSRICRVLGGTPPLGMTVEMFLDRDGSKFSKSRGNGFSVEKWLEVGTPESIAYTLYANPTAARKIHLDLVPTSIDGFMENAAKLKQTDESVVSDVEQPAWYALNGHDARVMNTPINFSMLLNVADFGNATDVDMLWRYLRNYNPDLWIGINPMLDILVEKAIAYSEDFRAQRMPRAATEGEIPAFMDLIEVLKNLPSNSTAEEIQFEIYEVGKRHYEPTALRNWFSCLYEVLLGRVSGPRFGQLAAVLGMEKTIHLIERAIPVVETQNAVIPTS